MDWARPSTTASCRRRLADQEGLGLFIRTSRESTCIRRSISFSRPNDRVEAGLAGGLGEVAAELVEHERRGRGALAAGAGGRGLLALVAGQAAG